uniref:M23 family metallopeptidase n=1 Tax=Polynucleobacter sp. TaxID=2029855 RepID=UPI004047DC71
MIVILDNAKVNKTVHTPPLFGKGAAQVIGFIFISLIQWTNPNVMTSAHAQVTQSQKTNKNKSGFNNPAVKKFPNSLNLSSEEFDPSESIFNGDGSRNLDYRIQRGCFKTTDGADNLPERLGVDDQEFVQFFKNQTKEFFERVGSACVPYAIALGNRNRFESLSIMNGSTQDEKTEIWTFTPSVVGGYLVQQDFLKDEAQRFTELQIPLNDVLYDPRKVNDRLPVELVWDLNAVIKQIHSSSDLRLQAEDSVVRLIVDFGDKERWAQIWAAEIINPSTEGILASAFWIDRPGIPGGFFTADGASIEHAFWTNPLSYRRISRGVGNVRAGTKKAAPPKSGKQVIRPKQRYRTHMGIDYSAPKGTPVFSVADGKVVYRGYNGAFGNLVILEHPGNYRTYYAHLSAYNSELAVNNDVRRGFEIGYVGSTGRSTGPHLHFELRKDGVYIDPFDPKARLDLWNMRESDSGLLTREILLLGTSIKE